MIHPHVTCLLVTSQRVIMAKRSIDHYLNQSYPNRTLRVISDGEPEGDCLSDYVAQLGRSDIRVISVPLHSRPLGALRNLAVRASEGEYVCQWDDDDLYHPTRLANQMACALEADRPACFMTDQLQWVTRDATLFWCDWARPREDIRWPPAAPNTLLCRRDAMPTYPEAGPLARLSEDLFVMMTLMRRRQVALLSGRATLYVYVSHGANTWDHAHHLRIPRVTGLDVQELYRRCSDLESDLCAYSFGEPLTVRSFDGTGVFAYDPDGKLRTVSGSPGQNPAARET